MADAPLITGAKRIEIAAREARLARALRDNLRRRKELDNLRRRKEQARARDKRADGLPDNQGVSDQGAGDEPSA